MKILMLSEGMALGGCETHVYELTLALTKEGHEVTLACSGGCFADRLKRQGIRIVRIPSARRDPLSLLYTAIALRRLARQGFDLVHAHTRGMALLARRMLPLPLCVSVHLNFHTNRLLRRICHFGEETLAVSEDIREYLIKEYRRVPEEITIIRNGVDLKFFAECRCRRGIVHLSRLDRDRSLCALLLCEAAPDVLHTHPDVLIHIFGDGNDFARVKEAACRTNRTLGYEGVILHGATTDIREALALGDVFVGVSRAAIEAMASHHACVIAGNDGYGGILSEGRLPSLLKSNFCARGMPRASATGLSTDLCYLLDHKEEKEECQRLCFAIAQKYYAREDMARTALEAYTAAIRRYHGRATLIGYYGYGNFGDEMTLRSLIEVLPYHRLYIPHAKKVPPPPVPKGSKKRLHYTGRYLGVLYAIMRSREVIFGGGTLFQNSTSTRSLLYYCLVAFFARIFGKRLRLLAGGVDTIRGTLPRAIARRALRCFDALSVRTEMDRNNLAKLIGSQRATHLPDAVFLKIPSWVRALPYVALIFNERSEQEGHDALILRLKHEGIVPMLIVLFPREDEKYAMRLSKKHAVRVVSRKNPEETFSLIAQASLTICERIHGATASLLSARPCFLKATSEKARGLWRDVDTAAHALGVRTPVILFNDYSALTAEEIKRTIKEAAGRTCGFEKIIEFFRECWRERLTPLLREPQLREQPPLQERELQQPSP